MKPENDVLRRSPKIGGDEKTYKRRSLGASGIMVNPKMAPGSFGGRGRKQNGISKGLQESQIENYLTWGLGKKGSEIGLESPSTFRGTGALWDSRQVAPQSRRVGTHCGVFEVLLTTARLQGEKSGSKERLPLGRDRVRANVTLRSKGRKR